MFCQKDPADLMTNPPILDIQFEQYFTMFCAINITLLEEEAISYIDEKNLTVTAVSYKLQKPFVYIELNVLRVC